MPNIPARAGRNAWPRFIAFSHYYACIRNIIILPFFTKVYSRLLIKVPLELFNIVNQLLVFFNGNKLGITLLSEAQLLDEYSSVPVIPVRSASFMDEFSVSFDNRQRTPVANIGRILKDEMVTNKPMYAIGYGGILKSTTTPGTYALVVSLARIIHTEDFSISRKRIPFSCINNDATIGAGMLRP